MGLDKVASLSVGFVILKVGQGQVKWGGIKLSDWNLRKKKGRVGYIIYSTPKGVVLRDSDLSVYVKNNVVFNQWCDRICP